MHQKVTLVTFTWLLSVVSAPHAALTTRSERFLLATPASDFERDSRLAERHCTLDHHSRLVTYARIRLNKHEAFVLELMTILAAFHRRFDPFVLVSRLRQTVPRDSRSTIVNSNWSSFLVSVCNS